MVDIIAKNVDRKGGQELNKVDRKVDRNKKSGQKIQNDTQETKNDTQG